MVLCNVTVYLRCQTSVARLSKSYAFWVEQNTQIMSQLFIRCYRSLNNTSSEIAKTAFLCNTHQQLHTTVPCNEIRKLARLRVVDNSDIGKRAMGEGRPPRCIHVYNKPGVGYLGDKVLVAIKGEMKRGILVGLKQHQKPKVPKFDSNNVVLIDENGTPLGTRIHVPIPTKLRTILKEKTIAKGADYTKVLAIASRYL